MISLTSDLLGQLMLRLTTTAIILVGVISADDRRPIRLSYQVVEQQPPGTFVANVALDAGLAAQLPADSLRHIRFRFLSESQRLLAINAVSGVITTADVIDRDSSSICRQMESCEVNVDVVLQPVQFFQVSSTSSSNAAFTPDTCSPDTVCIHLYPLSLSICILYRRQNCHGDMYPLVIHLYPDTSCSSGILVNGYMYLV